MVDQPRRRQVQDDAREEWLARQLRLSRSDRRTGSDARDEFGNRYELKTVTTRSVTTGRDIGPEYLERLRHSYFIAARGENTEYGFHAEEVYFLSPAMMEDWIRRIEERMRGDRELVDRVLEALRDTNFDGDLERLRQLGYRGFTINNPKISWSYIVSYGIQLQGELALHLRELVSAHPITPGPGVSARPDVPPA